MTAGSDRLAAACCAVEQLYEDAEDPVGDLERLRSADERVETQTTVYGALANEHRVRILEALRDGERCVCELQIVLDAPQSTVATHLRSLRDAGLVKSRKKGRWTYYRIADTAVFELLDVAAAVDVPTAD